MEAREVVSCNKGWEKIYTPIIEAIINHDNNVDSPDEKIGIFQIKEKWGCLDIQVINRMNLTQSIIDQIHNAHILSDCTCEMCGTTEHVGHTLNIWRKTLCYPCWRDNVLPKLKESEWKDESIEP